MKTLNDFFVGLSAQQIFKLGELAGAYSNRNFARQKLKVAHKEYEADLQYRRTCPPFEEVCLGADARVEHSSGVFEKALGFSKNQEKWFKRLRHEAVEAGISEALIQEFVEFLSTLPNNNENRNTQG